MSNHTPTPEPSEVAETTAGEQAAVCPSDGRPCPHRCNGDSLCPAPAEPAVGCDATRGFCRCDRPRDRHSHHRCPHCAPHPNATWADAEPDAGEVEALTEAEREDMFLALSDSYADLATWVAEFTAARVSAAETKARADAWDEAVRAVANVDPKAIHNPYRSA